MTDTEHRRDLIGRIRALNSPLSPQPTDLQFKLDFTNDIEAVLLDVYGTLFISGCGDIGTAGSSHSDEALTAALQSIGLRGNLKESGPAGIGLFEEFIREEHWAKKQNGCLTPEVDVREIWHRVIESLSGQNLLELSQPLSDVDIERLAVEYECRVNPVWPMPQLADFFQHIRDLELPCGIVSNAQFFTPLLFEAFLNQPLEDLGVDSRLCSWSYRSGCSKPSPQTFETSLQKLESLYGVSPSNTIYVGNDCLNDVAGAREAGCKTALFAGDKKSLRLRRDHPQCRDIEPDIVITELMQLPRVLS